jgi:hypothetical protein
MNSMVIWFLYHINIQLKFYFLINRISQIFNDIIDFFFGVNFILIILTSLNFNKLLKKK